MAHYDDLETHDPQAREGGLFARLPGILANAVTTAGWRKQLDGVDTVSITTRAGLATLPLLRKSDLLRLQQEQPPFGGFAVLAPGNAKRLTPQQNTAAR